VVLIIVVLCPISYLIRSLLGLYFPYSLSFLLNLSKFILVFDFVLVDSNPFDFFHYYSCAFCNMATFHVIGRLDLTIMVDESRTITISQHCFLCYVCFSTRFSTYI
jgi:hypothetical protein